VPFQVTMMLADAAQAIEGKLYILGGGWTVTGPDPSPSAIALQIRVPWDLANTRHTMRLELLDTDGNPVTMESPVGKQPLVLENEFEVGRPPGVKPGSPLELALAINLGPIPLAPGKRYEWRLHIGGETHEFWTLPFSTREAPAAPPEGAEDEG
jgi:hypothetical protein